MQLIIDATTVEELAGKVMELAMRFGVDFGTTETPITPEIVEEAKTVEIAEEDKPHYMPEETKKQKAKKKKEEPVAVIVNDEGKLEIVEDAKTFTKQDIANACQKVSEAKGLEIAREILATFGAKRISEVKEEEYGKFIEACEGCLA